MHLCNTVRNTCELERRRNIDVISVKDSHTVTYIGVVRDCWIAAIRRLNIEDVIVQCGLK